jgi:putative effector of murein hydrolase
MKFVSILAVLLLLVVCSVSEKDYTEDINTLKDAIANTTGSFYHGAYKRLALISDNFGPRLWGSTALETVIHALFNMAHIEGFENVRL